MSRKQILTKKVAHTILAMSIVSAGRLEPVGWYSLGGSQRK
jgi:hypothetical protein